MNGTTRSPRTAAKRRTLPLLLTLAAVFGLGTAPPAAAQYPTAHAPATPTPYSWPGFHAGGLYDGTTAPATALGPLVPDGTDYTTANLTPATPPTALVPDALFGMSMGTATGLVAGLYDTQIPSFLIGNYVPGNPPTGGGVNDVVLNHFADDYLQIPQTIDIIYAPFASTNQILASQSAAPNTVQAITVDDQNATDFALGNGSVTPPYGAPPAPAALTFVWVPGQVSTTASTETDTTTPPAATYSRVPVAADATGTPLRLNSKVAADHFATASWLLTAPVAGSYKVAFILPDPLEDATPPTEQRIGDAHYVIRDNTGRVLADTRISQTESNRPQYIAGPFPLNALQYVTVTLDNSTLQTTPAPTGTSKTYVIADAMVLQPAGGSGEVQGSPAVVNASEYPEIADALYLGSVANTTVTPLTITAATAANATGNLTPGTPNPDKTRRIRQMVYFTRNETVVHLDVNGDLTGQPVGAIYGVDGSSGDVVWRYQTPGGATINPTGFLGTGMQGTGKAATGGGAKPFQVGPVAYTTKGGATVAEGNAALATTALNTFAAYTAYDAPPILQLYNYPPYNYTASQYTFALYTTSAAAINATQIQYGGGSIRIYAGGIDDGSGTPYTADDNSILAHGTFTNLVATATAAGGGNYLLSGSVAFDNTSLQPGTWPDAVNLFSANPVTFTANLFIDPATGAVTLTNGVLGNPTTSPPTSAPIFTTPVVARIHVYTGLDAGNNPTYATRLVVVAADDAGYVYCLDAVGNRDGTDNVSAIDPTLNQPKYGLTSGSENAQVNQANYATHVGTTHAYWVYRPDPTRAKVATAGQPRGVVGKIVAPDSTTDLPAPGTFGLASPAVDILARLTPDTTSVPNTTGTATAAGPGVTADGVHNVSSAVIYIGNSNGTLYKLDTRGVPLTTADIHPAIGQTVTTGDRFSPSLDLTYQATAAVPTPGEIPTPTVQWWLPLNGGSTGSVEGADSITSAPALRIVDDQRNIHAVNTEIYVTSANNSINSGRLFRVDAAGPVNNTVSANSTAVPGSPQYNIHAQARWSFPNAYTLNTYLNGTATAKTTVRPSLGSIGGSPVVFTQPTSGGSVTHVYFAANVRQETGTVNTAADEAILNAGDAGRIWSVNTNGTYNWAYPSAQNPNVAANDVGATPAVLQPEPPIGGFENATPAIGRVQFPARIEYGNPITTYDHKVGGVSIKGQSVPMLYVGTIGTSDVLPRLYGIDLDGTNDRERTVFADYSTLAAAAGANNFTSDDQAITYAGLPQQAGFASSPALVTNNTDTTAGAGPGGTTAAPGNGGALFVTETDGTLYQFHATPESNDTSAGSGTTGPDFGAYTVFGTAGPYSSPAVSAFDATDLNGTTPLPGTTISGNTAVDTVFVGDSSTGLLVGISPSVITNFGSDGGFGTNLRGIDETGINRGESTIHLQQFPLYVYLFDGTPAHPGTTSDMTKANLIGGSIPPFEWGDSVYIRVANVVPPNPNDIGGTGAPALAKAMRVTVPDYPNVYFTNGSPVSIQISETDRLGRIDVSRGADVGQVPAILLNTPPGLSTTPPGNGFVTTTVNSTTDATGKNPVTFAIKDVSGTYYIGAYTYAIGDGSSRKNTPGSRRRIVTATQTAQAWDAVTNQFISTVTLTATVQAGGGGRTVTNPTTGARTRAFLPRADQPTFAILNPLALNGLGLPIESISKTPFGTQQVGDVLGPFGPLAATLGLNDLPAFSNGNRVYQTVADLPKNGILGGSGNKTPSLRTEHVVSTTGLIGHGTTGGTVDPTAPTAQPSDDGNGLAKVADRSDLGPVGKSLKLTMAPTAMQWNDNGHSGNTSSGDQVNGEAARINRMPWEDVPTAGRAGQNHSLDYPDIAQTAVRQVLTSSSGKSVLTSSAATPDPAGGTAGAQTVQTNSINVQIRVPKYQPANTQLFDSTNGDVAPQEGYVTGTHYIYPMGYTAQMRIFVDSDRNHVYSSGEAYRDLTVYTGVPIDMGTTITSTTTDLGALTQGFGVQTRNYTALGPFDPYSTQYYGFFRPVTAFNTGNVNLLNVRFDQIVNGASGLVGLPFSAGSLDADAVLRGYDSGGVTGADAATPFAAGTFQSRYTLRSSLDGDLEATSASKSPRNPGIVNTSNVDPFTGTAYSSLYPGATFHKARPNDGSPTTLRVPDVPYNNNVPAFYVAPTADAQGRPQIGASAVPYIGLAVPIGTPVGTYSQNVRLFEGIDTAGFDPLKGPQYGGAYGGRAAPSFTTAPTLQSALTISGGQPYSTATQVVAKVEEVPITDTVASAIALKGTVPHGDTTNYNKGDFSPSVFRDAYWNGGTLAGGKNIDLYWTSSRDANTTATSPPYNIVGKILPFTVSGGAGYFDANLATPRLNASWYQTIAPNPGPVTNGVLFPNSTGLNTGLSVAQEQHTFNGTSFASSGNVYAFVQNLAAYGGAAAGAPVYQSRIYCFPITTATGQLAATPSLASSDPAQAKFGVKGLKIADTTAFIDPLSPSTGPVTINQDLWAFWGSGARGRSSIGYTSTLTSNGAPGTWTPTASLSVPAGLASTADPSPVLITAPDKNGKAVFAIDVTYTGIGPDGSADLYVSRYRPYMVKNAAGTNTGTVGLALSPFPSVTESLQADPQVISWQARDVAWVRDTQNLDVAVNGTSLALAGLTPQYDRASGTLVYTGVTAGPTPDLAYPNTGTATVTGKVSAVYIDLVRGRVRFRITQTVTTATGVVSKRTVYSLPATATVTATFASEARRITSDTTADTEPVTFLDEAFKPNEASFSANLGRVQANRAWYIWRKGAIGKTGQPSLFYKTQRLTVALKDKYPNLSSIMLDANGIPQIKVTGAGGTLYNKVTGAVADVDWARGRIYLPLFYNTTALEGQLISVSGTGINADGTTVAIDTSIRAIWEDEGRYNDVNFVPADTSTAVPVSTAVNEGTASAFLDPMAYADVAAGAYDPINGGLTHVDANGNTVPNADQPHKIWLYWSSTRNGTADIYSEAIEPRFSVRVGGGSVP